MPDMTIISPKKSDTSVCRYYNSTLKNCSQSGNAYPVLLDGQRTRSTDNCTHWPETREYYTWNKNKQPRIILVIPHGWCAQYITLACCTNTAQRIYRPLRANVTVHDNIDADPQPVNSSAIWNNVILSRVDLDRCRPERYLGLQVDDPPSFQGTVMYHFISEVEVHGHQGAFTMCMWKFA